MDYASWSKNGFRCFANISKELGKDFQEIHFMSFETSLVLFHRDIVSKEEESIKKIFEVIEDTPKNRLVCTSILKRFRMDVYDEYRESWA